MTRKTISLVAAGLFTLFSVGGFGLTSTAQAGIMRQLRVTNNANCSIGVYANGRLLMTLSAGERRSWGEISDGPKATTSLYAKAMDNSGRTWTRSVSGNVSNYNWPIN